ncbi:MAG: LuxR C-terminal-related transcriptional regulator [Muribaculaceae bacterium]|nr:LuxR C-terminal-related transcriptional regulator [Muribaculaceae bacterium]
MDKFTYIFITFLACIISSCSKSDLQYRSILEDAEKILQINTDSAVAILDRIDPSNLKVDSLRAKYHYLLAFGHMRQNRSMIGDSLVSFAHKYYSGKDVVRDVRSATAYAWYKFWVGDTPGAIAMLDSIVSLSNVSDSLVAPTLRVRVLLGASEYQGETLISSARRLVAIEKDSLRQTEAKYMLLSAYENAEKLDSALLLSEELIDYARSHRLGDKQFMFELERAQILGEMGRTEESNRVVEGIFKKSSPDNGAADYLHIQLAMNALNSGNLSLATKELAIADSFAVEFRKEDDTYYRSYSNLVRTMIDFKQNGKMKLGHVNGLNNRQQERYNRAKASQWESERSALQQQSRALALKTESQHKTVVILVIALFAIIIIVSSVWIIRQRRLRERENEERAEALQKMVDELKSAPVQMKAEVHTPEALRRAMLQQLGIIKMVAETPTEQNREMLRKISSIESDTDGELVNWNNVFELINTLYVGFYDRLQASYSEVLTLKEKQIILLMIAGFSTKEISVITGQTTSTIYVRKTSIRKKLGIPEKEDIVTFLREKTSD